MTIPEIILDKDNDEVLLAKAIEACRSKGLLATHEGSPIKVLLEGLTFLLAEYRWYLNLLPQALALEVFKSTGLARNTGSKATGRMTFLLDRVLNTDFVVPAGFPLNDEYQTTEELVISAGLTTGIVPVIANEIGEKYNASAFQKYYQQPLTFVETTYNEESISGGRDIQPLESYIQDIQQVLRTKETLLSQKDYEEYLFDKGIIGYCFGQVDGNNNLDKDNAGNVHIYVTDDNNQDIQELQDITSELQSKSFVGSSVFVSNVERVYNNLEVVAHVASVSDSLLETIVQNIADSIKPSRIRPGEGLSINELSYVVRNTPGVIRVSSVLLDNQSLDSTVPNFYTIPVLDFVTVSLIDNNGLTLVRSIGAVGNRENMDEYNG